MTPAIGLWVDCRPGQVLEPGYWDRLGDLGVRSVALMVDRSSARWDPWWSVSEVERACRMAIERDIEVILTTWPAPSRRHIERQLDGMEALLPLGAAAWEIDVEGLWRRRYLDGYASVAEAGSELVAEMRRLCDPLDVRIELTTHPGHRESGPEARLSPLVDRMLVQAYSVRHRPGGRLVGWSHPAGPGAMQHTALRRAAAIAGVAEERPALGVGLAAWDQLWPGHTPAQALDLALEAALAYQPVEVRLWSSKWVVGRLKERAGQPQITRWLGRLAPKN